MITFNPNWPEVRACLQPGQTVSDIPIIVACVFKSQLKKVLHLLCTCFREKKYLIKVIEFQKHGFPHAHIIIKVWIYSCWVPLLMFLLNRWILRSPLSNYIPSSAPRSYMTTKHVVGRCISTWYIAIAISCMQEADAIEIDNISMDFPIPYNWQYWLVNMDVFTGAGRVRKTCG